MSTGARTGLLWGLDERTLALTLLTLVLGAVLGWAVRLSAARRERRVATTIALHAEFHTPVFLELRIRAHDALSRVVGGVPAAYAAAELADKQAIYALLHYFERVALLLRSGEIDYVLLRRFLRQYIGWWRPLLCGEGAPRLDDPEWGETLGEIEWLFGRIGPNAPKVRR